MMKKVISEDEFHSYMNGITVNSKDRSCDYFTKCHMYLSDKYVDYYGHLVNAGDEYIKVILNLSRFSPKLPPKIEEFIESRYLSDVFMNNIVHMLERVDEYSSLVKIVKNKSFDSLDSTELSVLYAGIREFKERFPDVEKEEENIAVSHLKQYLFHLNSEGAIEFMKNTNSDYELGKLMIENSGMSSRIISYVGAKMSLDTLNEEHLFSIYKKMVNYKPLGAEEFIKLIDKIETLSAIEFVRNYDGFIRNGFSCKELPILVGDVTIRSVNPSALSAFVSNTISRLQKKDSEERASERDMDKKIREGFKSKVEEYKKTTKNGLKKEIKKV